jgi:hypothetical protein
METWTLVLRGQSHLVWSLSVVFKLLTTGVLRDGHRSLDAWMAIYVRSMSKFIQVIGSISQSFIHCLHCQFEHIINYTSLFHCFYCKYFIYSSSHWSTNCRHLKNYAFLDIRFDIGMLTEKYDFTWNFRLVFTRILVI